MELDLNVNAHDDFDEAAMHKVDYRLRFLPELVDQVREMIAEELEQDGTSPQEYRHFHCNAIKDEHLRMLDHDGRQRLPVRAAPRLVHGAIAKPQLVPGFRAGGNAPARGKDDEHSRRNRAGNTPPSTKSHRLLL